MVDTSREQIKKHTGFLAIFSFKYMIFLLIHSVAKALEHHECLEVICLNMLTLKKVSSSKKVFNKEQ